MLQLKVFQRFYFKWIIELKFKSKMQFSVEELETFYADFENEFTLFFEELRNHVEEKLVELNEI